jgi:hypothetical protein
MEVGNETCTELLRLMPDTADTGKRGAAARGATARTDSRTPAKIPAVYVFWRPKQSKNMLVNLQRAIALTATRTGQVACIEAQPVN